ncbi:sensor histidine kinase [Actinomadura syzygii]|uniref:histidine kinase n=1 Tax=Actinomadura syzygii TaxID=1427538 RepID=A0A5D0TPZ5_9ACTN|nr:sensor histidine kinase [Actinomadura syzygii]TYC07887.1 sensor histidine kinase [Actinomadura syzygii]
MSALPLSRTARARHAAWTALAWSGAVLYPFFVFLALLSRRNGYVTAEMVFAATLTVLLAVLMIRHPLKVQAIVLFAWTWGLLQMHNGTVAALLIMLTDLGVGYIAAARPHRVSVTVFGVTLGVQFLAVMSFLHINDFLITTMLLAASVTWLLGNSIQVRRTHAVAMREQALAQAVAAERLRIARELHDMVAHSIGIIAIQAGVGGRVIDTQPAAARNALDAIEVTSRDTLAGLRRMVTALRKDAPEAAPLGPTPGLGDLDSLVRATEDAGVRVELRWFGERRPLPPDVDLSAYRIVQEAVTNVVRHADTDQCRVTITYRDKDLAIEIDDEGRGGVVGAGYGIAGMRERVSLLHGGFTAGPRRGGGFRVAAAIPVPATVQ